MNFIRRLLFRNFRFVYKISQWAGFRLSPAGILLASAMIASGIFGVDIRQSMAFQVFAIASSLLLVSFICSLSFRAHFTLKRMLPDFGTVNQPLRYKILIVNRGKKNQEDLLIIDDLDHRLPEYEEFNRSRDPQDKYRNRFDRIVGYPRLVALIRNLRGGSIEAIPVGKIVANDFVELELEFLPIRRGYINFSSTRIGKPDPVGLIRSIKKYEQKDKLLILPKTYRTPKIELKGLRKYQQGGMTQASIIGDSQEFMSLREYRPGDPLRAIHWRSYAKTGTPVVKEFHDEFFVRQGLILDTFQENKADNIFEEAISLAASFCLSLPGQDSLLDLMFIGEQAYRFTSGRGLSYAENMLEILACTEACHKDSFNTLYDLLHEYSDETSGIVCILLDWDDKRKKLIEFISKAGIPVVVFVIVDENSALKPEPEYLKNISDGFFLIHCENIQASLDQTSNLILTKE